MIIGIISDTHDKIDLTARAVDKLVSAGAQHFFHCGDVCSPAVLDAFAGLTTHVVLGNNDFADEIKRACHALDLDYMGVSGQIELAGKSIGMTHGDRPGVLKLMLESQAHDYVFFGHSHARTDERMGRTRAINPGALQRVRVPSVAVLDLATDVLKFHEFRPAPF